MKSKRNQGANGEEPPRAAKRAPSGRSEAARAASVEADLYDKTQPLDDLARHRVAIDALDREILARLNERARHAQAIGKLKGNAAAYRPERETQVLRGLHATNEGPLP